MGRDFPLKFFSKDLLGQKEKSKVTRYGPSLTSMGKLTQTVGHPIPMPIVRPVLLCKAMGICLKVYTS